MSRALWVVSGVYVACQPDPAAVVDPIAALPLPTDDAGSTAETDTDGGPNTSYQSSFAWLDVDAYGDVTCGIWDRELWLDCWGDPSSPVISDSASGGTYVDVER